MNIARIYFPVKVLGYGQRVGIWTCGCNKDCENCESQELKSADSGFNIEVNEIVKTIISQKPNVDGITISGGEPMDQAFEVAELMRALIAEGIDDILLYSGYTLSELDSFKNVDVDYVLGNAACLILGPYVEQLNNGYGIVGSLNQEVVVHKYFERYSAVREEKREQQIINCDGRIIIIGLSPKETSNG